MYGTIRVGRPEFKKSSLRDEVVNLLIFIAVHLADDSHVKSPRELGEFPRC